MLNKMNKGFYLAIVILINIGELTPAFKFKFVCNINPQLLHKCSALQCWIQRFWYERGAVMDDTDHLKGKKLNWLKIVVFLMLGYITSAKDTIKRELLRTHGGTVSSCLLVLMTEFPIMISCTDHVGNRWQFPVMLLQSVKYRGPLNLLKVNTRQGQKLSLFIALQRYLLLQVITTSVPKQKCVAVATARISNGIKICTTVMPDEENYLQLFIVSTTVNTRRYILGKTLRSSLGYSGSNKCNGLIHAYLESAP